MCDSDMRSVSSHDFDFNQNNGRSDETIKPSNCQINDLGEYELIKILSYFPIVERIGLSRVCLKWKSIIEKSFKSESVLNASTVLGKERQMRGKSISHLAFGLIIRKCCNARHIVMSGLGLFESEQYKGDDDSDDNLLLIIAQNCQHLQSIDFGLLEFDQHFETIAKHFFQLKKIISQNMSESALNCIIDSPNLELIDISKNLNISRPEFKRLGPKIRELYLKESEVIDELVIRELCEGNGKHMTNLSLDVKDNNVLSNICTFMKDLNSLDLSLYHKSSDFTQFSNLNQLKSLSIDVMDEPKFESQQFRDLVRSLKGTNLLEMKIILSPVNNIAVIDSSLQEIRENCQMLEKLVIRRANSLTDSGMYAIAKMKRLKYLDLMNCLNIGDGIDIVITSCPLLRHLNLHNCSKISVEIIKAFIEKAKANADEKFSLDVIDSYVPQNLDLEMPSNLECVWKYEDCIYDCDHGWGGEYGYNSDPQDDMLGYEIDDFYDEDEDEDLDYFDDYDDDHGFNYHLS